MKLLLFTLLVGSTFCQNFYPINWNEVVQTQTVIKPQDLVKCLCDLTFSQCDPNCCCDTECTDAEKALFSGCLPDGILEDDTICIDSTDVAVVNRVSAQIKDDQLCVIINNNPSLGFYFSDPSSITVTNFDLATSVDTFSYNNVANLPSIAPSVYASNYKVDDLILKVATPKVPLVLPAPNIFGQCSTSNPAAFLDDNQTYTCNVYSANLATDCATLFSATQLVQGITIAQTPADAIGTSIQLGSVNGVFGAALSPPSYSGTTCTNALLKLSYVIVHNGAGRIMNVSANVQTTTVQDWGAGLGTSVSQTFSIMYLKDTSTGVVRPKSGNPGYLIGDTVLLGNSTTTDGISVAILQPIIAPALFGATATGTCAQGLGPTISFGEDIIVGCQVQVPSALLTSTTTCQAFASSILSIIRGNIPTYVGKFGNANYLNQFDWASVFEVPPDPSSLDSTNTYCTNIPNQIRFQFITTYAGPLKTPQNEILAGKISYSTVTVSPILRPYLEVYAAVTFSSIASIGVLQENLPAPPLMKPLPSDILYPFKLSHTDRVRFAANILFSCLCISLLFYL